MNFKVSQLKSLTAGEVAVDDLIYVIDSNPTDGSVKSKKVTVGDLIDSRIYGISSSQFVLITGYYADPSWITSLDWSKITNAPSFVTSLSALTDVSLSSPVPNQLLRYNGTSWYNWTPTYYSLPAGGTTLQYIDGTGALQTLPTTLPTSTVKHLVKAGVPITKGQAVYVTSADGTNMIVGLASNASESTSSKTMGLLDATVTTNGFANVVTEGLLAGLDTTGANAAGDPVWLGTGGNLIYGLVNKPYAPNHLVFIGIVTRRNANNGEIFVKVQNGFELSEIHDVDARNPDNNDGIFYNSTTQLWEHKQISSVFPTPTLASVTTAGNTTTNSITVGGLNSTANINAGSNLIGRSDWGQGIINFGSTGEVRFQNSSGGGFFYTWYQNGNVERMRLSTSNNLLIGTATDAGYRLDVNGTGRYSSTLTIQTAASDASPSNSILISTSSSGNGGRISWGDSNTSILRYSNSLYFREYTGNFRFESTGSGAALLHISEAVTTLFSGRFITSGSTTATSALARGVYFNNTLVAAANNDVLVGLDINPTFTNGAFTGVSNYAIRLQNSGLALFDASIYSQAGSNAFNTTFSITGTAGSDYTIYSNRNFIFNTGQSMYFNTDTDGGSAADRAWYFAGARTGTTGGRTYAAITIDGSGFPSLTIYNNDNGGRIQLNSNAASYFNGGNLLVGTTTDAGYKLDVSGTIRFQDHLIFSSTKGIYASTALSTVLQSSTNYFTHNRIGSSGTLGFQISVVGNVQSFWRYNDGTGDVEFGNANGSYHLGLYAGNTERVKILGNGNVGIGTTSPTAKVHVVGSGSTSATNALLIQNSSGTQLFKLSDDGTINTSYSAPLNCNFLLNVTYDITCRSIFGNSGALSLTGASAGNATGTMVNVSYYGSPAGGNIGTSLKISSATLQSAVHIGLNFNGDYTTSVGSNTLIGYNFAPTNYGTATLRAFQSAIGGVYVNTTSYQASAILQADSTTQGFLPPRLTSAQRTAISSPAAGLCVFDTDLQNLCFFRDGVWVQVSFAAI